MRLGRFTIIAGACISLGAGLLATHEHLASNAADITANAVVDSAIADLEASRDLTEAVDRVKVDVIQVQQFLTDISATRGLDGLNDGFDNAKHFAEAFAPDLDAAQKSASGVDRPTIVAALTAVKQAFVPYYATGQKMAAAYVAQGPAGGNKLMPEFDAAAETMGNSVDKMQAEAKTFADDVKVATGQERTILTDAQRQRALVQLATYAALIGAIAIMTGFMSGYALRRIRTMSRRIQAIAAGDYSQSVYGSSVWEELKDIAAAADIFRHNGLQLAEMSAAEATNARRAAVDRTEMMQQLQLAFGRVVDAAIVGDFSQRVTTAFPDAELNALGSSVNTLVETVDRGLGETGEVLSALANTDLTQRITGDYRGAFAKLKSDTNAVAEKLTDIVAHLKEASGSLKVATGEILAGANDLSERTTKQATTIAETTAAVEQLAATVNDNASKAEAASLNAMLVHNSAQQGQEIMAEATTAMEKITGSSVRISNIIGMIDDIAFQTNLLALNASVEAARAGDAGKGFAVVAVEVRRLAQSAAQASNEVKLLIDESANEVSSGSKLVADAAENSGSCWEAFTRMPPRSMTSPRRAGSRPRRSRK